MCEEPSGRAVETATDQLTGESPPDVQAAPEEGRCRRTRLSLAQMGCGLLFGQCPGTRSCAVRRCSVGAAGSLLAFGAFVAGVLQRPYWTKDRLCICHLPSSGYIGPEPVSQLALNSPSLSFPHSHSKFRVRVESHPFGQWALPPDQLASKSPPDVQAASRDGRLPTDIGQSLPVAGSSGRCPRGVRSCTTSFFATRPWVQCCSAERLEPRTRV